MDRIFASSMDILWPQLEELKNSIEDDALAFITAVWDEFFKTNKWPSTWTFNSRFGGRSRVRALCANLGGILYEGGHGGDHGEYTLTLIGALLVGDSLAKQKLLTRYFELARDRYRDKPEERSIKHTDVEELLRFTSTEIRLLNKLLSLSSWHGGSSSEDGSQWQLHVPSEVQDLPREGSLSEQVQAFVWNRFSRDAKVFYADRELQFSLSASRHLELDSVYPKVGDPDALSRRYQVFVSSTFRDLEEERQHVVRALMEMDCIPIGMELFPASPAHWKLIERMIDECDYYLLILAGKYGTVDPETNLSFTEREFDYASRARKSILAFFHANLDALPGKRLETTDEGKLRLERFTSRVKSKHMCRSFDSAVELGSAVKSAVFHQLKNDPKPGWIRASAPPRS